MFGFQFYYCHEPGHQIDADLGCGLSSHQQPQSLESAVLEAGAGAELSWLSSRHCLPWGGSPPVSPPSSSWPLGRFWYREEYFVKYSEEKYIYVFKRNVTENEITLNSSIIIPFHCQIFPPGQCPSNSSRPDFSLVFALLLLDSASAQLNNVFYLWQSVSFILSWAAFPKIEKQNISLRVIISYIFLYLLFCVIKNI